MYRVLKTSSKTLISVDEVVNISPTSQQVEARFINTAIQIAEARFIKPIMCGSFYEDFRQKKNTVATSINLTFLQSLLPTPTPQNPALLKIGEIVNAIEFVNNSWYVELWNEVLWKTIAECVIYIASPANYSRFTAQGEMENNPKSPIEGQDAASVDLRVMKWKMDRMMQDRIDPMIAVLEQWLYDKRTYFPLMDCKDFGCNENGSYLSGEDDGISIKRKTAWIFGVYPLSNRSGSCCDGDR